jgi:hypothetical protein
MQSHGFRSPEFWSSNVAALYGGGEGTKGPRGIQGDKRKLEHWTFCVRNRFYGQATKGVRVDALAQTGDEGRGQLR